MDGFKYGLISLYCHTCLYMDRLCYCKVLLLVITSVLVSIVGVYVLSISIVGYFKSNINTVYRQYRLLEAFCWLTRVM